MTTRWLGLVMALVACRDPSVACEQACVEAPDGAVGPGDAASQSDAAGDAALPPGVLAVAAGRRHTCARGTMGAIKCWGDGVSWGELGLEDTSMRGDEPGEMGPALPEVDLGSGRSTIAIAAGGARTCAILDDHTVKCWGENDDGQLGIGKLGAYRGTSPGTMGDNLERIDLGPGRTAKTLAMGRDHTCAILDDDTVKCWGLNYYGELGLGDKLVRGATAAQMGANLPAVSLGTGRIAKALALGDQHSCALLDNSTVKCWGRNDWGQLGLGSTSHRGDGAGEMGDALPAIDFGTGRTVVALASGPQHACAALDDGGVKCWGDNVVGELGTGPSGDRGDEPGEMGDSWPAVPLGTGRTALAVAMGWLHSCALLDTHQVKCWGYNSYGNLGLGDEEYRVELASLGDALPAIDFGPGRSVIALSGSEQYTCAVLDDRSLRCWGQGNFPLGSSTRGGWLGLGDRDHRGDEPGEMGANLPAVALW